MIPSVIPRLGRFIDKRCEQIILEVLNILSEAIYLLPISRRDFEVGAWTPLCVNHENVVLKYIARAGTKLPTDPVNTFLKGYARQLLPELVEAFDLYYTKEPVEAHKIAIQYNIEITRLKTFLEVLYELGDTDKMRYLAEWVGINPVETAENDWS